MGIGTSGLQLAISLQLAHASKVQFTARFASKNLHGSNTRVPAAQKNYFFFTKENKKSIIKFGITCSILTKHVLATKFFLVQCLSATSLIEFLKRKEEKENT